MLARLLACNTRKWCLTLAHAREMCQYQGTVKFRVLPISTTRAAGQNLKRSWAGMFEPVPVGPARLHSTKDIDVDHLQL